MTEPGRFEVDDYDDAGIAQQDVVSAARSCSAILIIAIIVGLILCLAVSLSYIF
jgi:hypothetical protein